MSYQSETSDLNPYQSEKQDPDLYQSDEQDPDLNQNGLDPQHCTEHILENPPVPSKREYRSMFFGRNI
jgi:hypothetical protein